MIFKKNLNYLLFIFSLLGYFFLYYGIERDEFFKLIAGVVILGVSYFYWLKSSALTIKQILVFALVFRVVLLFDAPNFSDDYNRFLWDGIVLNEGMNPYENTPNQIVKEGLIDNKNLTSLYDNLNSQGYYTVYPPLNQFFFSASFFLSGNNWQLGLFFMKLIILLFDMGLIYILMLILRRMKLKENLAQIYALNPLVIIELTGNVHFEGVMIFFLFLGIYTLMNNKVLLASVFIGLAISVKLVPLLLLPLFLPLLGFKKSIKLYLGIGITSIILVVPFISQAVIDNFSESLNLYFQSFEFNASFYYVFKSISYYFIGYKSSSIGVFSPMIVFGTALLFTFLIYKKKKSETLEFDITLFAQFASSLLFVFYLLASTVHPWYVINILVFSVFIKNKAFVLWSLLAFISYFAYSNYVVELAPNGDFHQFNLYYVLVFIEYLVVLFWFLFDLKKSRVKAIN